MKYETFRTAKDDLTRHDLERIIERYRQEIATHYGDLVMAREMEWSTERRLKLMETMERDLRMFRDSMDWWVGEDMVLGNLIPAAAKGDEVALARLNEMRAKGKL